MVLKKRLKNVLLMLFGASLLFLSGCGRNGQSAYRADFDIQVCVLKAPDSYNVQSAVLLGVLQEIYPSASCYSFNEFSVAAQACLAENAVMLLADSEYFPVHLWKPMMDFLYSGGKLLVIGERPFEQRIRMLDGKPVSVSGIRQRTLSRAITAGRISSIQLWGARAEKNEKPGIARIAQHPDLPWSGVEVRVDNLNTMSMLVSPDFSADDLAGFSASVNGFGFYARGADQTTRLSVLCEMQDGQQWASSVVLSEDWRPYVLPFAFFKPVKANQNDEDFDFRRIRSLAIGLNNTVAPQLPGEHQFGLSDVKLLPDIDISEFRDWPELPLVCPPFMHCHARAYTFQNMSTDEQADTEETLFESPVPVRMVSANQYHQGIRSIPLYIGYDANSIPAGWGSTVFVSPVTREQAAVWGWIGIAADYENRKWLPRIIRESVGRIYDGAFLCAKPELPVSLKANEVIPLSVQWSAPPSLEHKIRVVGELLASDGRRLRRIAASFSDNDPVEGNIHVSAINLGRAPSLKNDAQDYTVRVTLEDVAANGRVYDESIQYIKVFADKKSSGAWLKCSGSRFLSERQAVYLMGVDYMPLNNLLLPSESSSAWLDPHRFSAQRIRQDLAHLSELSINAVKISYERPEQAENLRFFVAEAERFGIRVAVELSGISPLKYDLTRLEEMIAKAQIAQNDNIFALYFSPETFLNTKAERDMLNPAWRDWLETQYGSIARAEKLMGRPGWRENGTFDGPTNKELQQNGAHTIAVAVYRRFVEDYISRQYGFLVRFIRRLGCRQLITAVSAPVTQYEDIPFDLTAGGIHFDYLSPSAAGLAGSDASFYRLGFISAYARGGRGMIKPVVWSDFGTSVGPNPKDVDLQNQARVYDAMFDMINMSSCAGSFGKSYSASRGFGVPDYGIVRPTGQKRPVSMTFPRHARRLRNAMIYPATWRGRVFSKSSDARGLAGLYEQWGETYADELQQKNCLEIRPFGFGTTTEDMPRLTLGGVPFAAPAPLECANAEWGQIWVNGHLVVRLPNQPLRVQWGDKVRIGLINTGVATWSPSRKDQEGTVWVKIMSPRKTEQLYPVAVVPPGNEEYVEWNATEAGKWIMRPVIFGLDSFGEELSVIVEGQGIY